MRAAIDQAGLKAQYVADESKLVDMTVERLVAGKVVGWFQGRSEFGPRALGNRSILADPRRPEMKDAVNSRIKFREPFRPFAPSVLVEQCHRYFDLPEPERHMPARFMLLVVPVHESMQDAVPAVNHLGTARVQTVHRELSPTYYQLIQRFGEASGIPVLLNTSFNVRGEPIVNSPHDALRTFSISGIDTLVMGNYCIDRL